MPLHSAGHRRGVVSAPHHSVVEAGRAILAEGGNALEAMVAMAATAAAVYPHMNHIGGDGYWVVRRQTGRVDAIMAAGPAGAKATPELYRGYETIPIRGPLAALTVPGAVGGWMAALEAAKASGGKLPLDVLLAPAIAHARNGYVVTRSQAQLAQEFLDELAPMPGFAETFLADGQPPEAGTTLKQEALAETLAHLAHTGLDDFYRGDVGREIAADLERIDSPVTREDFIQYGATLAEPLSVDLEVGRIFNTDAPTQGIASLMILALFERLNISEAEGFDHIHGLVEATKLALRARDRSVTDPSRLTHPLARYLEPRFIATEAMKIDRQRATPGPLISGAGDTVWMGAADASGLVVSSPPIDLLGVRLRLCATGYRRPDAEPRRKLFAAKWRAQPSRARAAAIPYAQSRARGPERRSYHGVWRDGRARPAADARRRVHAIRVVQRTARGGNRSTALVPPSALERGEKRPAA